jgi:hypothetical protein
MDTNHDINFQIVLHTLSGPVRFCSAAFWVFFVCQFHPQVATLHGVSPPSSGDLRGVHLPRQRIQGVARVRVGGVGLLQFGLHLVAGVGVST